MSFSEAEILELFPVEYAPDYFNTAGAGLTPLSVSRKVQEFMERLAHDNVAAIGMALSEHRRVREMLGAMIHANADDIALVHHTAEAANALGHGLRLGKGDKILTLDREYPSTIYPWMNLEKWTGAELVMLEEKEGRLDEAAIAEAIRQHKPRLFAISAVEWTSGYFFDLEPIGRACEEVGAFFLVDAAQALGFCGIDVERCKISALTCSAWKWLFGPAGMACMYLRRDLLDSIAPLLVGPDSMVDPEKRYFPYDFNLKPGVERFEYSTPAFVNMVWFAAALDFVREAGIDAIREHVFALQDDCMARLRKMDCLIRGDYDQARRSGIIAFRWPDMDSHRLSKKLGGQRIYAKERDDCLRLSMHLYNTPRSIDRLFHLLDEWTK
ncbi:MAG: aminotransferase class V-fold PLP-dependent enzyme [Candidatus Sumerlaeia bacterium]